MNSETFRNPFETRRDFQEFAGSVWRPVESILRKKGLRAQFGPHSGIFGQRIAAMEGFARILWGVGPWQAGCVEPVVDWELFRQILLQGVSPGGWGEIQDREQRMVETPVIALALVWAKPFFWDPLTVAEKRRVADWMGQINRRTIIENNWIWFRVLTNAALRALGADHDAEVEKTDLAKIDGMWRGELGYSDGPDKHRDYYIPMAMHFYGLIYARLSGEEFPERAEILRARARSFAIPFQNWFDIEGQAPAFGRSMHYRFAQGAFWSALAYADEQILPWGTLRGLLGRHLRSWAKKSIVTDDGILSVGYGYCQPQLMEAYGSSGSPYWALKALLALALPDSHPFWTANETPCADLPAASVQPPMGVVATRPRGGRDVVLLSANLSDRHWLRHNAAKYHKFAYSAQMGFSISHGSTALVLLAPDSALALSEDGLHWRVRDTSLAVRFEGETIISEWAPWPDVRVVTRITPEGDGHVREHTISSPRPLQSFEGGFCVPRDPEEKALLNSASEFSTASWMGFSSSITGLEGDREGVVLETDANTHILWPLALLPGLQGLIPAGTSVLRCRVFADSPCSMETVKTMTR